MESSFHFTSKTAFKYQQDGQNLESNELLLIAPSYKTRKHTNVLKQLFFRAAKSFGEANKSKKAGNDDDELKAEDIVLMLNASSIDMNDVYDAFEKVLLSGHCKIEGEIDLRQHHLDTMDIEDVEEILGRYLADFLLASWMSKLTSNS